jgi:hypothetical protein
MEFHKGDLGRWDKPGTYAPWRITRRPFRGHIRSSQVIAPDRVIVTSTKPRTIGGFFYTHMAILLDSLSYRTYLTE